MNPKLQAVIDAGRRGATSMWCAADKHGKCRGRRIDDAYDFHRCECSCHQRSTR